MIQEDQVSDADLRNESEVDGHVAKGIAGIIVGSPLPRLQGPGGLAARTRGEHTGGHTKNVRLRFIHAVLTGVIISTHRARDAGQAFKRCTGNELGVRNVDVVSPGLDSCKQVATRGIRHHTRNGSVKAGAGTLLINFNGDTRRAFAGIRTTVLIGVNEHQVPNGNGTVERKVDGHVAIVVVRIVHEGIETLLGERVRGFTVDLEIDHNRADAARGDRGGVDPVFTLGQMIVHLIVRAMTRHRNESCERLATGKFRTGNVHDVSAGREIRELVTPTLARRDGCQRIRLERIGGAFKQPDQDSIHSLAGVEGAVSI